MSACLYFTTAESFVFSRLVATFWLRLMREQARPCLSVPRLRLNKNWIVNHLSWARFCPSCELWNVIVVVWYTISSRGVGAFAASRRGGFCFYLQIPKSGSFYLLGCTQKPVWLAGSSAERFVRWRFRQRDHFFYSSNSNIPKRRNSASLRAWIWKHFLPLSVACMSHFFSLSFTFTRFNKAEHRASGHDEDRQLCWWSRWKSTPGHIKSEIFLKLDEKTWVSVKQREEERERGGKEHRGVGMRC